MKALVLHKPGQASIEDDSREPVVSIGWQTYLAESPNGGILRK